MYVKIADLGISRRLTPGGVMGFKGSPGFMAPEILKYVGTEACTEKVGAYRQTKRGDRKEEGKKRGGGKRGEGKRERGKEGKKRGGERREGGERGEEGTVEQTGVTHCAISLLAG